MEPYGIIWSHMGLCVTLWRHMNSYGPIWCQMVPYGAIWGHMEPHGATWGHMVPYGAIWCHMEPYGGIWSIWSYMIWLHMAPYGSIWIPYDSGCLQFSSIWITMVPYGSIIFHMAHMIHWVFRNAQGLCHSNSCFSEMHMVYATATCAFPKCTGLLPHQHLLFRNAHG